jgi:hypothetical protein
MCLQVTCTSSIFPRQAAKAVGAVEARAAQERGEAAVALGIAKPGVDDHEVATRG